jgi:hypothetical protein
VELRRCSVIFHTFYYATSTVTTQRSITTSCEACRLQLIREKYAKYRLYMRHIDIEAHHEIGSLKALSPCGLLDCRSPIKPTKRDGNGRSHSLARQTSELGTRCLEFSKTPPPEPAPYFRCLGGLHTEHATVCSDL